MKFDKICILGLGYIGLPTASTFAANGIRVLGVDVNTSIIETLRAGGLHIHEPGLREALSRAVETGNLTVSTQPEEADAFLIAVPTPFYEHMHGNLDGGGYKLADMRAVISASEAILPFLRKGNLVVLESTSPPRRTVGTTESSSLGVIEGMPRGLPHLLAQCLHIWKSDGFETDFAPYESAGYYSLEKRTFSREESKNRALSTGSQDDEKKASPGS